MSETLLHPNASKYELALDDAFSILETFEDPIESIATLKSSRPLPDGFGPFLIWEVGLSSISEFFQSYEEILDNGLPWIELRETPAGVTKALSWIGYTNPALEDQNVGLRKWNRYQINMGQLPPIDEVSTLNNAEYLADLSDGARDVPFRAFFGYDIRALRTGHGKTGHNLIANASGVRVANGSTIWSHGEERSVSATATAADRTLLGVDYTQGQPITWEQIPWNAPGVTWQGIQDVDAFKTWRMLQEDAYIAFFDQSDDLIGMRRVGRWKEELSSSGGVSILKFTAHTGFGDASGKTAVACCVVFHASNINAEKPGQAWLDPDEIVLKDGVSLANASIGKTAISIDFKETVRVKVEHTLTI